MYGNLKMYLEIKKSKKNRKKIIFFDINLTQADCVERLKTINPGLAKEVRKVLDVNKLERHIRGGMATKEKYLHTKDEKISSL